MNFVACNIIFVSAAALLMAGCASSPTSNSQAPVPAAQAAAAQVAPVAASYSEKVVAVGIAQVKGSSCPASSDTKWTTLAWEKLLPVANACVKAKDWLALEKVGDVLAKQAHLTPWGPYYLALAAEGRRDYPRAVWMLELALKKDPKEGLFHYELGRIHWELHEDPEAVRQMRMASEMNPSLTEAHWVLGQLALQNQDLSEAESRLQKALASNGDHYNSLMSYAQVKIMGKDWSKAESLLSQAVTVSPRSVKARLALAHVQEEGLKKRAEALSSYKQIKQLLAAGKLDEGVQMNLDEKIQSLQKSLTQVTPASKVSSRQPTAEGQVAK